jgi:hypothetical protein
MALKQQVSCRPAIDCHLNADFNLVLLGWASDAVSLPLGFVICPTDGAWADDARALLQRLKGLLPPGRPVTSWPIAFTPATRF